MAYISNTKSIIKTWKSFGSLIALAIATGTQIYNHLCLIFNFEARQTRSPIQCLPAIPRCPTRAAGR